MSAIASDQDYIGLSEPSSEDDNSVLNLKQTELRLGLPGSDYPERKLGSGLSLFGRDLKEERHNEEFQGPLKSIVSGAKRGFSDALNSSGKWALCVNGGSEVDLEKNNSFFYQKGCKTSINPQSCFGGSSVKEIVQHVKEKKNETGNAAAPAAKAQVVGWPPVRSFRKNTLATNSPQNSSNNTAKSGSSSCLFVKVSMDGAPYLRKINLKTYSSYAQLSSALEKMFSCFTIGQYEQGFEGQERLSDNFLVDLLHGCEYVLTYEDKDGDWMLVGDVPWEMFTDSCRRLRIMKGSEAIGLAPRTMHKCKRQN